MKHRKYLLYSIISLFLTVGIVGFTHKANRNSYHLAFYNLENLFDTLHTPNKQDYEYLPSSQKKWGTERYSKKIHNIARVIASINEWQGPDIIGLCEVENKAVLHDLINKTYLKQLGYEIVHHDGPDQRGIDVALLYKKDRVTPIDVIFHPVDVAGRPTREVLHFVAKLKNDTLHYLVNHWSSRFDGTIATMSKRAIAGRMVRKIIDSVRTNTPEALFIITGDFNDNPEDLSIVKALKVGYDQQADLYNTSYYLFHDLRLGTHKYQDKWNLFDQMIISKSLVDNDRLSYKKGSSRIYSPEWLQVEDTRFNGKRPFRTFIGRRYMGGYSDHFAVYLTLTSSSKKRD